MNDKPTTSLREIRSSYEHDDPRFQGCWKDRKGRFTPDSNIDEIDKLQEDLVIQLVRDADAQEAALRAFKSTAFRKILAFVDLAAMDYKVEIGGEKGNLTLYTHDQRYKVTLRHQELLDFDVKLQAAKALIDECIADWVQGADENLVALVRDAFDVDTKGRINSRRVLSLRRLKITDERWQRAMQAISDSVVSVGKASYINIYERIGEANEWQLIPLSLAGV
jgi:hypothetical protein